MGTFLKLLQIGRLASPEMKMEISKDVDRWRAQAEATPGQLDDTVVAAVKIVLLILGLYVSQG